MHEGYVVPGVVTGKPLDLGGSLGRREATGRGVVYCSSTRASTHLEHARRQGHASPSRASATSAAYRAAAAAPTRRARSSPSPTPPAASTTPRASTSAGAASTSSANRHAWQASPAASRITNEELLELECDVLVPAALERSHHRARTPPSVKCRILAEGANGPTTPEADAILDERGDLRHPRHPRNAGGVIVSYFEWVQDLQNYFWTEDEVNSRLKQIMSRAFQRVHQLHERERLSMRLAGLSLGVRKVAEAKVLRGLFP